MSTAPPVLLFMPLLLFKLSSRYCSPCRFRALCKRLTCRFPRLSDPRGRVCRGHHGTPARKGPNGKSGKGSARVAVRRSRPSGHGARCPLARACPRVTGTMPKSTQRFARRQSEQRSSRRRDKRKPLFPASAPIHCPGGQPGQHRCPLTASLHNGSRGRDIPRRERRPAASRPGASLWCAVVTCCRSRSRTPPAGRPRRSPGRRRSSPPRCRRPAGRPRTGRRRWARPGCSGRPACRYRPG